MKVARAVPAIVLALVLAGCSRHIPLAIPAGSHVFLSSGGELSPFDPRYQALEHWLASNQDGWEPYLTTEPAGGIIVQAGRLRVHFFGDCVVIDTGSGLLQKRIKPGDYDFLSVDPKEGK